MADQNRLVWASVFFGVAWALGMIWWSGASTANVIVWSIAGVIAGVLWFFGMRWYFRLLTKWRTTRHGPSGK